MGGVFLMSEVPLINGAFPGSVKPRPLHSLSAILDDMALFEMAD